MGIETLAGAAAVTGIAGAVAGGVGGAIQAGQGPARAVNLPPELETVQIGQIQQNLADFEVERNQTLAAVGQLEDIAQTQLDVSQGLIPTQEGLQRLTEQTQRFGEQFGDLLPDVVEGIAQDLQSADFGTEFEAQAREEAQRLLTQREDFKDPQVERELSEGRNKLRQRLAAQFGPGFENTEAGIRALQAFEQGATELRFDVSQRGRSQEVARLQGIIGGATQARGTQLATIGAKGQFAQQLFAGQQGALGRLTQQVGAQNIGAQTLLGARELGRTGLGLVQQPFGLLQAFGQQNISRDTRRLLQAGTIGPGSLFEQTGVPRRETGRIARTQRQRQQQQFFQNVGFQPGSGQNLNQLLTQFGPRQFQFA